VIPLREREQENNKKTKYRLSYVWRQSDDIDELRHYLTVLKSTVSKILLKINFFSWVSNHLNLRLLGFIGRHVLRHYLKVLKSTVSLILRQIYIKLIPCTITALTTTMFIRHCMKVLKSTVPLSKYISFWISELFILYHSGTECYYRRHYLKVPKSTVPFCSLINISHTAWMCLPIYQKTLGNEPRFDSRSSMIKNTKN
jgi:hypothetical protein